MGRCQDKIGALMSCVREKGKEEKNKKRGRKRIRRGEGGEGGRGEGGEGGRREGGKE